MLEELTMFDSTAEDVFQVILGNLTESEDNAVAHLLPHLRTLLLGTPVKCQSTINYILRNLDTRSRCLIQPLAKLRLSTELRSQLSAQDFDVVIKTTEIGSMDTAISGQLGVQSSCDAVMLHTDMVPIAGSEGDRYHYSWDEEGELSEDYYDRYH